LVHARGKSVVADAEIPAVRGKVDLVMKIRHFLILPIIVLGVSTSGCHRATEPDASAGPPGPAIAERARLQFFRNPAAVPEITLTDLDGKSISSTQWRGKVTLVNFWATWCPPCRAEIPDLIALQEKYRGQLQIIGISQDEAPPELVKRFVAAQQMNYPVAMTTPAVDKAFPGIAALPTTYMIDRDGRIVQRHVGMLTADRTELETRALAGLPVNASVEEVDRAQPLKLDKAAQLKEIPGVDLAALTPEQRATALQKLNSDGCTCGCDLTLARCRVEDPNCGVSLPLSRQLVKQITAGKSE
jgi:thiol-disulfide isomerase/thioredoxin